MNTIRLAAIALIVAGALALTYGSFSYTKETHELKVGSMDLSLHETENVNIPVWLGIGAIGLGTLMLLASIKK